MSVKYCPQCGAKNEAEAKFCTECGSRFPEETFTPAPAAEPVQVPAAEQNAPVAPAESAAAVQEGTASAAEPVPVKKKKKTGLVIVLIILALIIAAGAVLFFTGNLDRMMATSKAGAGDYIGALESYENYLSRSGDKSTEAYTQASLYALSAGDADKALMYARSVPEKSEEADSLAEKAGLVLARNAIANKDWQGTIEFLRGIGGDEAKKLTDEANYHLALEAAENEQFETAIALLEDNSFELSGDILSEYRYHYGVALMNEGKYEEAIAQFDQTSFADSDDLRGECYFRTSVDYAFLQKLKEACYTIMNTYDDAQPGALGKEEGKRIAVDTLKPCLNEMFYDSELEYYAQEFVQALEDELVLNDEWRSDSVSRRNAQMRRLRLFETQSSSLEQINAMYPYDEDTWAEIYDYFDSSEYWGNYAKTMEGFDTILFKTLDSGNFSISDTIDFAFNFPFDYNCQAMFYLFYYDENDEYISLTTKEYYLPKQGIVFYHFDYPENMSSWGIDFELQKFDIQ